jgi:hypothetical protein
MINDNDDNIRKEVHALYQKIAQEQPPKELDQAILNLSVTNVKPKLNSQSFWRQHRWSLSSAASVLMVVTLFVINPPIPTGDISDEAIPSLMMTPQDSPAPALMRMASPNQALEVDISPENNVKKAVKTPLMQQSNSLDDNQDAVRVEAVDQQLLTSLNKVSELMSQKDYAQAERDLQLIKSDYAATLLVNAPLNQRFNELETLLKLQQK